MVDTPKILEEYHKIGIELNKFLWKTFNELSKEKREMINMKIYILIEYA